MTPNPTPASELPRIYVISGDDPALVYQELTTVLQQLAQAPALAGALAEEFARPSRDQPLSLGPVLDALHTAPFFADLRLVVARDAESLDAGSQRDLVAYLKAPCETAVLVLAYETKPAPAAIRKAVESRGVVVEAGTPRAGRSREEWFTNQLSSAPVRLERRAIELLKRHLGEDVARLDGILSSLVAAYGEGAHLGEDEVTPFLGTEGAAAPWDLTDALDRGDTEGALHALSRLLAAGDRQPLGILASLHRHFGAILRLDGEDRMSEREAATATGLNAYPASKALRQARLLGHAAIAEAIRLIADADLDLRGRIAWPAELVLEVLVARLSRLSRPGGSGTRHGRATAPRGAWTR